jgi:hypothetical protein
MATLYKRATPSQARVLRIVAGAVKNAAHAHPGVVVTDRFARSVAKRAAGTLTAQWPDVLAAGQPSDKVGADNRASAPPRRSTHQVKSCDGGERLSSYRRSPLHHELGIRARDARKAGNAEREAAFVEALRLSAEFAR